MKKYLTGFALGLLSVSLFAWAATTTDILYFGYGGINYAKEWVDGSNRVGLQAMQNGKSTAQELWPTAGTKPAVDSLAEITLNRYLWSDSAMERMNISAMIDSSLNGAYRFGVERSGTGQFRDMVFCFENVTPGIAVCNFKVTPTGAYVSDDGGNNWRKL